MGKASKQRIEKTSAHDLIYPALYQGKCVCWRIWEQDYPTSEPFPRIIQS